MNKQVVLHIVHPGLQSLVQDQGRLGPQAYGIPIGGAMDKSSARIANRLVGNPENYPTLEIAMIGPKIRIEGNCYLALSGADLSPHIDGQRIPMYETLSIKSGSILSFARPVSGCRTYLAAAGEWQVPTWMGSHSAYVQAGMELPAGSVLSKGNRIEINTRTSIPLRSLPLENRPTFPSKLHVRVLSGPEFEQFSSYQIGHFFSRGHRLLSTSNRMGYRLNSTIPEFQPSQEMISSGIVPGTIQITTSGQPIILMADAQTTGGYYRIANVISDDMDALGQVKPGEEVWFELQ